MKKLTILLCSGVLCLAGMLAGCDNKTSTSTPNTTSTSTKPK